ncbi:type VI secretion system-associated protein TagF [Thioclava sp. FTW29]|uniref:Type VI secretion system-associated protein TagF n=1 Tax=Thioclava litoralis TaxID=3076557 RepID=A0ABZ1E4Q1_9RHOB|nr:type VI secretion system-associated protein TagF [Thioclava sp. FTW29]
MQEASVLNTAPIGLLGKHPGYGDFLQAGLGASIVEALNQWLDASLGGLRDEMGNDWPAFWDRAQELRFWVGRGHFGQTLAGVLRPSHDKVGRRFPLLLLTQGADLPAPTDPASDQSLWDRFSAHLDKAQPGQGAAALLHGLDLALPDEAAKASQGPQVWAHHPEGDLAALLRSAATVERERAMLTRVHFWTKGEAGRAAQWIAGPQMPDARVMGWLLGGMPEAA